MIPGRGVAAKIKGKEILAGNLMLLADHGIRPIKDEAAEAEKYLSQGCTMIYVAIDNRLVGYMALSDSIRPESVKMIDQIQELDIQPVLLTGDHSNTAKPLPGSCI